MTAKNRKKAGFFSRLLFMINVFFAFALLGGYSASLINPHYFWPPALLGLAVPYLFVINIGFAILWMIRKRWWFLLSAIVVLAGTGQLHRYISLDKVIELEEKQDYFKISSYNVKNLSNDNVSLENDSIRQGIFELIKGSNPDILCLQEFMAAGVSPENWFDSLGDYASLPYFKYMDYIDPSRKRSRKIDAIVTYSKFPIINTMVIKKDDNRNLALATDILYRGDTVRVFNTHLESIHLQQEDYEFISEMPRPEVEDASFRESSWNILLKLRRAFRKRAVQSEILAEYIKSSPHPVILCGDFNDTPSSFSYRKLKYGLKDAFVESGRGLGNTYAGKLPANRIDFILYDEIFSSYNYHTVRVMLSDHYMITTFLHRED